MNFAKLTSTDAMKAWSYTSIFFVVYYWNIPCKPFNNEYEAELQISTLNQLQSDLL